MAKKNKESDERKPCKFCGHLFHWKGIGVHQAACKENPIRSKKVLRKMAAANRKPRRKVRTNRVERVHESTRNLAEAERTFDLPTVNWRSDNSHTVSVLIAKLAGNVEGWLRAQAEGHGLPFRNLTKIVATHLVGQSV